MSGEHSLERLKETYNRYAQERERMDKQDWKSEERLRFIARLAPGMRVLEIGPGPGKDSLFFSEQGMNVSCVDLSEEMVKLCRQKGLDAHVMDFGHLEFPDRSFDAVYGMNCLLHAPKARLPKVLQEIRRVLKPGGLFFWGVYGGQDSEGIWEKDTYEPKRFFSFFTDEGLLQEAERWFQVEDFHTVPMEGSELHFQSLTLRKSEKE